MQNSQLLSSLALLLPVSIALWPTTLLAEPLTDSWLTELSGRYARIYPDNDARDNLASVTTWSRGQGTQAQPTYAGVSEVAATDTDVYIRTPNLGFHIMGPWYGDNGNLFPNYPSNRAVIYRFPRTPVIPTVKVGTGLGAIGYFVDGVAAFDSRDAFSYDTSAQVDEGPGNQATVNGDGIWNRDAYTNESPTFDPAFAHQAGNTHHYHANPPGLRNLLGDSVDYDAATHTYSENFNGQHSPILGWSRDDIPIYGPYGYSDPVDASSPVRRMITGYQKRDGSNGSDNLATVSGTDSQGNATGRTSRPAWLVRNETAVTSPSLNPNQYGPAVSAAIPVGHYLEDYVYKGDLGFTLGTDFDLNEYNIRHTLTPDSPDTPIDAYFTNILPDGTPVFPYNFSRYFYAQPSGNVVTAIPANALKHFEGGPEKELAIEDISVAPSSGDVSLTWSSAEGGHYRVEHSPSLDSDWATLAAADGADFQTSVTDAARQSGENEHFYRVALDSILPFDDAGFDYDDSVISEGPQNNVLLLIIDDWGIDSSDLFNAEAAGIELANLPNLNALSDTGLLFTRGYAQPLCSPTRATIMTGRQPYQHTVGNPQANSTLPASELTLPEILTAQAPDYGLASFGKWHLGSGSTGAYDTGGWPNFTGTLTGGLPSYSNTWERVKIVNGVQTDAGTTISSLVPSVYTSSYATSVQVDEAAAFITAQGSEPWFVWMGFNAPHDPFEDPPANLAPAGGYSTTGNSDKEVYIRMLEALDTEVGRLLTSVNLAKTNVIVIGDNGTPGQVDQPPAGGIAGAKGSLTEGGIHVPFFAKGPDILQTGTSDKLVHVVDLFATILDLAGVNVATATDGIDLHSRSLVPIFNGTDNEDRCIIAEKYGINALDGRALILDDWPQYKLLSLQDVTDPNDIPTYEMYLLGANGVEASQLTVPPAVGDPHEAAYLALVAKDESLALPVGPTLLTVDIDLPSDAPPLINPGNGNIVRPNAITIGGVAATWDTGDLTANGTITSAARVNEIGAVDQFSVVATFDFTASGLTSGTSYPIVVSFPGAGGVARTFTATNQFTAP